VAGAIATGLHEGSRSEYLAQYVFSMFGTSVPVLHQEDHGIDLFCSLTERKGRRSWPVAYYSVQVKSTACYPSLVLSAAGQVSAICSGRGWSCCVLAG
jgi:hypothetical protein